MGIDATIPENVPRNRYQRIAYFNEGKVDLADYLGKTVRDTAFSDTASLPALAQKITEAIAHEHRFFAEILDLFPDQAFGSVARALALLKETGRITQDAAGKYQLKE